MSAIPAPEPWRSTPPVELVAAAWLAGYASPRTRRTYRTMIRSWFDWCLAYQLEPLAARRAHVELWQRHLEHHGYAVRTIALKLTAIASFYRYCEQEDLLARTPMTCVRRPRVERLSPRGALTRSQIHDLLAAAHHLDPHPYGPCCLLAFNGLRIGEATSLNVDDLDYDGLYPVLRFTRKGGRPGVAVLARPTEAAITACIDHRSSGPLLLNTAGRRVDQRAAQRILDRAVHGLHGRHPRVTPHVLRHTWTTLAIDAGVPHDQIQHDGGGPTPAWSPTTPTADQASAPPPTASPPTSSAPPDHPRAPPTSPRPEASGACAPPPVPCDGAIERDRATRDGWMRGILPGSSHGLRARGPPPPPARSLLDE